MRYLNLVVSDYGRKINFLIKTNGTMWKLVKNHEFLIKAQALRTITGALCFSITLVLLVSTTA